MSATIRDAASGFVLERPGLERLRGMVRSHDIDVVLAFAVDRLSRNQNHIGVLFDEISSVGLRLEFAAESFEDTAVGRFILAARAFVAEIEREKISERTMRGKAERAKSGRMPQGTGRGMYGYRYNASSGRRETVEVQAAVVRRIFDEFASGASIVGLANKLNEDGITTFLGKQWHPASISHLLKNPVYAGRTLYRRTRATSVRDPKTGKRRRQVIERPEADWIEVIGAAEAIVSQNVFGRVQARLADPERLKMGHRQATYGLAGHVRCAACGRAMVGQTLQGNYRYYRCRSAFAGPKHDRCQSRYVRADRLESAVKTAVAEVLTRPEIVAAELERLRNVTEAAPQVRDEKLGMLEGERRRVLSRYQLGDVDDSFLEDELARIRREKERLAARPISLTPSPSANFDIPAICDAARAWLENAAGDDITLIAGALDLEVTASREHAELIGKLPLTTHHWTNIGMTTWT